MNFPEFLDILLDKDSKNEEVHYVQLQNGNLKTEFEILIEDVEPDIPFATEAFGIFFFFLFFFFTFNQNK